jgi:hypothetical protein
MSQHQGPRRAGFLISFLALAVSLAGCQGEIGNVGGPSGSAKGPTGSTTGGGPESQNPDLSCTPGADPGATPLLRLSAVQYRNTIKDLLAMSGVTAAASDVTTQLAAVPDDSSPSFSGLDNRVSINHLSAFYDVASSLGDALTTAPDRLTAVGGACATTMPLAEACFDTFLSSFGRHALRRPLTTDEMTSFHALNDGMRAPAEVLRMAVTKLLLSPSFLNHVQVDGDPIGNRQDLLKLSPYEIASRLSYHFWQTMPDEALFAAAEDGSLGTDAGYAAAVDRLVSDPRAKETAWTFWSEWLKTGGFFGFSTNRPAFDALVKGENVNVMGHDVYADMVQELRDLTELFTWNRSGTIGDLLGTDLSVTKSADLAHIYGLAPWDGTSDYAKFPAGTRGGLLTRSAVLVIGEEQTNPFHRGASVRRSFLCDDLPKPDPATLPPGSLDPPPVNAAQTTRDRFGAKVKSPLCQGCHSQFSNIGFVLEAYDSLGRYRTKEKIFDTQTGNLEAELPIDLVAAPRILLDDQSTVNGPAELTQRIVDSHKVEGCFARQYFRYTYRRQEGDGDGCAVQDLGTEVAKPGAGIRSAFKLVAMQPSFRQRKVGAP